MTALKHRDHRVGNRLAVLLGLRRQVRRLGREDVGLADQRGLALAAADLLVVFLRACLKLVDLRAITLADRIEQFRRERIGHRCVFSRRLRGHLAVLGLDLRPRRFELGLRRLVRVPRRLEPGDHGAVHRVVEVRHRVHDRFAGLRVFRLRQHLGRSLRDAGLVGLIARTHRRFELHRRRVVGDVQTFAVVATRDTLHAGRVVFLREAERIAQRFGHLVGRIGERLLRSLLACFVQRIDGEHVPLVRLLREVGTGLLEDGLELIPKVVGLGQPVVHLGSAGGHRLDRAFQLLTYTCKQALHVLGEVGGVGGEELPHRPHTGLAARQSGPSSPGSGLGGV